MSDNNDKTYSEETYWQPEESIGRKILRYVTEGALIAGILAGATAMALSYQKDSKARHQNIQPSKLEQEIADDITKR
jgi:hypothetical protein